MLRVMAVVALVALNVSVICFYRLWQVADTIAVNRAEEHGFDPQQLLPHSTLFWFAAHASLLSLLALDALVIAVWRRARRRRRNPLPGAVGAPLERRGPVAGPEGAAL